MRYTLVAASGWICRAPANGLQQISRTVAVLTAELFTAQQGSKVSSITQHQGRLTDVVQMSASRGIGGSVLKSGTLHPTIPIKRQTKRLGVDTWNAILVLVVHDYGIVCIGWLLCTVSARKSKRAQVSSCTAHGAGLLHLKHAVSTSKKVYVVELQGCWDIAEEVGW